MSQDAVGSVSMTRAASVLVHDMSQDAVGYVSMTRAASVLQLTQPHTHYHY